ncbi:hypothetical protein DFP72DRAFT_620491 [Ephemerocybe angulata]|uniref:Secreted protein n=1 Tax=Ephemerocybe angulata TaxID=980116 RepID=A0A8H6HI48_9AGAR|nr:hypothetical protein DFP72DRAFT_620491 [Tulosesus angulatus]
MWTLVVTLVPALVAANTANVPCCRCTQYTPPSGPEASRRVSKLQKDRQIDVKGGGGTTLSACLTRNGHCRIHWQ